MTPPSHQGEGSDARPRPQAEVGQGRAQAGQRGGELLPRLLIERAVEGEADEVLADAGEEPLEVLQLASEAADLE